MMTSVTGSWGCLWGLATEWGKKGMEINPRKITDNIEIPPSAIRAKKKMPVLSLDYFIWDVYIN